MTTVLSITSLLHQEAQVFRFSASRRSRRRRVLGPWFFNSREWRTCVSNERYVALLDGELLPGFAVAAAQDANRPGDGLFDHARSAEHGHSVHRSASGGQFDRSLAQRRAL